MDMKVKDYPHLRRRGAGIVNTDADAYHLAVARARNQNRLEQVEHQVQELSNKIDIILALLQKKE